MAVCNVSYFFSPPRLAYEPFNPTGGVTVTFLPSPSSQNSLEVSLVDLVPGSSPDEVCRVGTNPFGPQCPPEAITVTQDGPQVRLFFLKS